MPGLCDRKKRILECVIEDYVQSCEPVGSRTVSRKYMQDLSSATIRNEMSDLTEMGYLYQPHVSAGRVPSTRGYRLYVNDLLDSFCETAKDEALTRYFLGRFQQLEDVVSAAAQALSDLTRYPAVMMTPKQDSLRIISLQLVPVSELTALLVMVTDGGLIRDTVVHISGGLDADSLYAISRMLTRTLGGRTIQEVERFLRGYMAKATDNEQVFSGLGEMIEQIGRQSGEDTVRVTGVQNILNYAEYADVEKARAFLCAAEEKESLLRLITPRGDGRANVHIAEEHGIEAMRDCAVVSMAYKMGRNHLGAIGVIGPARMPYRAMMHTLSVAADCLSRLLGTEKLQ